MKIEMNGKVYLIEQTKAGMRVGVVIEPEAAQHAYVRWLRYDSKRAGEVIAAANAH